MTEPDCRSTRFPVASWLAIAALLASLVPLETQAQLAISETDGPCPWVLMAEDETVPQEPDGDTQPAPEPDSGTGTTPDGEIEEDPDCE